MAHPDHAGQRFADVRRWLDISHRALGRLAIEHGVQMHESLWASWEQRPAFPQSSRDTVKAIIKVVAERLEGEPEKTAATLLEVVEHDKKLPKAPAVWREGMKPVLRRGRRAGVPQKPELRLVAGENQVGITLPNEAVSLATDVVMEAMSPGAVPLPEKVKELLKLILQSNMRKAVPVIVSFWLGLLPSTQNTMQEADASSCPATPRGVDMPRASNVIPFPSTGEKRRKKRAVNR